MWDVLNLTQIFQQYYKMVNFVHFWDYSYFSDGWTASG